MDGLFIVWPEKRFVPRATIETWYADAVANGDVKGELTPNQGNPHFTLRLMGAELDDAGIITLSA